MSTYYRFRSAERLLGRAANGDSPARPGELDDLTIYFASPQELNDPLEGHRETYFEGDLIVWRNLIKHYTLLLYAATINVYASGEDGTITDINLRPQNFPEQSQQLINKIIIMILSCPPIADYINSLAGSQRRVSRLELSVHLMTLHNAILTHILSELEAPLEIPDANQFKSVLNSFLDFISMRSKQISIEGSNPDTSAYKDIKSKIKQQFLRGNAARESELNKGMLQLFVNFPDEFCQQIDYLIYPRWYVACFIKSCSNSAIWGSYGDNHKGICLIYKSKEFRGTDCLTLHQLPFEFVKAYNWGRPKNEVFLAMPLQLPLAQVKYEPIYTKPNFFTSLLYDNKEWVLHYWYSGENEKISSCAAWLSEKPSMLFPNHRNSFQQSLTTKTAHWENETESRIIISGLPWKPEERLAKYYFSELEGLIFGINTPDEVKVKVIRKIAFHCAKEHRSNFKFYQARFDETYSTIEHDHLKHITFNIDGTLNLTPAI